MTRIDSLLSSHTESVSFSDRTGRAPPSILNARNNHGNNCCARKDSHFHAILHVQVTRTQLCLNGSLRTFHCSNLLMPSNACLCQNRCPVPSRQYAPSDLNNARLPIRFDLNVFVRTQESKHHLLAVLICLRTHFCRGHVAVIFCKSP